MDTLLIKGPNKLTGSVRISKAKNSALPILAGTLLCENAVTIVGLPKLRDITTMNRLLIDMGVAVSGASYQAAELHKTEASYELVKTMRASILVLGPLLTRFGTAKVSLPGGCAIGTRPIDIHLDALKLMGAEIKVENGYVEARASQLRGAVIKFPFPSVGATENLLMAAVYAEGKTILQNAAREPEINDLCEFLLKLFPGLKISGIGTSTLEVIGINKSQMNASIEYQPIPDRIEACTFIIAGLMTNSEIEVLDCEPKHFEAVTNSLQKMGAKLEIKSNSIKVYPSFTNLKALDVETEPFPGFPTDVQAQLVSLMCVVSGESSLTENIFENRFMHVPELNRMGAKIEIDGKTAHVKGGVTLTGAPVMCTDLRASAALVLAGLVAKGETRVQRVYHIDRGYEKIDEKLQKMGVNIQRVNEPMS